MQRLRTIWLSLQSSLWFVPFLAVMTAIGLAIGLTTLDFELGRDWVGKQSLIFGVGADGARGMLSSIAGSMMTVASLTFSLTISTLATASSQYTSRLIRNFMRDRFNQFVLGYFVGLFAYCLVVLRTIRGGDENNFVPSIAVLTGLLLALISIGVLIFFIHHIASSIQASSILHRVTDETVDAIDEIFPKHAGDPAGDHVALPARATDPATAWQPVIAGRMGYVQNVNAERLLELATQRATIVRMAADIGAFVTPAGPLCHVAMRGPLDDEFAEAVRAAYSVGVNRTIKQDPAFGVRQIVDIGLKALSPGVNDTTTGVMCVEHLGTIVEAVARRDMPDHLRAADGTTRLIARGRDFETLVKLCFDQIRGSADKNVAVLVAMVGAIQSAARQTADPRRRAVLREQVELVDGVAHDTLTCDYDRTHVRQTLDAMALEFGETIPFRTTNLHQDSLRDNPRPRDADATTVA